MKKINQKLGGLIGLLVILMLLLAACGGAAAPTAEPEGGVAEEPAAPTEAMEEEAPAAPTEAMEEEAPAEPTEAMEEEAPTAEPTEDMAEEPAEATGEPLKIGVMSDLTGALALFGNEMVNGLTIGFEYATDGSMSVAGRPIELITRDDTGDVEAGAAAARELIEAEGVEILIGNTSSAVAQQVQQIADENEIVYLAAPAASPDITGANFNEHTFRVCRNSAQDALTIADYALANIGENYQVLAEDYAFGQATAAGFDAVFS
ncbi:MAG: ABC transporter substrate-binding protein, partial [Ardenticatenaceae bacterium]